MLTEPMPSPMHVPSQLDRKIDELAVIMTDEGRLTRDSINRLASVLERFAPQQDSQLQKQEAAEVGKPKAGRRGSKAS